MTKKKADSKENLKADPLLAQAAYAAYKTYQHGTGNLQCLSWNALSVKEQEKFIAQLDTEKAKNFIESLK